MRAVALLALFVGCGLGFSQAPDPAYASLTKAYDALRASDYGAAIAGFLKGIEADGKRASIRKDLAYTYLKVGETELAREQFRIAMDIDPADVQVALEFAFLCYETKERQQARRIFDRVRKSGLAPFAATAEQAFQNVDAPLAGGIERWKKAIEMGSDNFSAHFELATLAEERDELELAATHFERAWRMQPERRSVLVDMGRVWTAMNRTEDARAAYLAASRGGEPRAAETARALLPERYPYVSEFRRALELDPGNAELRRELGFLLLKMDREPEGKGVSGACGDFSGRPAGHHPAWLSAECGRLAGSGPAIVRACDGREGLELANRVRAVLRFAGASAGREAAGCRGR